MAMTPQIATVFIVYSTMAVLFLHGQVRYDVTAVLALMTFVFTGLLTPEQAFSGFSSPTVIILFVTFFIGEAIFDTGVSDRLGRWLVRVCGTSEPKHILAIMTVTALISTTISNVATTIIMMPIAAAVSRRARISPSRLFLPISIAAVLGGTVTLIGTSSNLITSDILSSHGLTPFGLFEFTPIGFIFVIVGIGLVILTSKWSLPLRQEPPVSHEGRIRELYGLHERLFSIKIPITSFLAGRTLSSIQLGATLNLAVVEIRRPGQHLHIPAGSEIVRGGDVLIVRGHADHLRRALALYDVIISPLSDELLNNILQSFVPVRVSVSARSLWCGKRIDTLELGELGFNIIAVEHKGRLITYDLSRHYIEAGDVIIAFFGGATYRRSELIKDLSIQIEDLPNTDSFRHLLFAFSGKMYFESLKMQGDSTPLSVALISPLFRSRLGKITPISSKESEISSDDLIIISSESERLRSIPNPADLEILSQPTSLIDDDEEVGFLEAAVTPRSILNGQTISQVSFRERFGVQVLALWREGKAIRTGLAEISIKIGDTLLLYGAPRQFERLSKDPDFVVLSELPRVPHRQHRTVNLVSAGLLFALLASIQLAPLHVLAVAVALFLVATRAVSIDRVYRSVDLRLIIMVGALLPLGIAFDKSGAAAYTANLLYQLTGNQSPHTVLLTLILASSILSQFLDSGLSVVLLTPVAITTGQVLNISPYPLAMGIALGASIAFIAPFSHRAHLLVMSAGGYKRTDYMRIGLPLTIILIALTLLIVPMILPFKP